MDFDSIRSKVREKIVRLEAEAADPWREVRKRIEIWRNPVAIYGHDRTAHQCGEVVEYVDHLTAENDRLAARVAELEADSFRRQSVIKRADELCVKDVIVDGGMIRTITEITFAEDQYKVFCGGWVRWYDKDNSIAVVPKPLAVAKPDPDDPILDPARVLATAEELMWGPTVYAVMLKPNAAKPYRLKGGDGG